MHWDSLSSRFLVVKGPMTQHTEAELHVHYVQKDKCLDFNNKKVILSENKEKKTVSFNVAFARFDQKFASR